MSRYILQPEQFAFMQAHHEEIELALIEVELGNTAPLKAFINSTQYQQIFGNMGWDDALDRYEDTPGYDISLRMALREQLRADVEAGKVQLPPSPKPNRKTS